MNHDIQFGDVCVILRGLAGTKSPNVGKQVTVGHTVLGDLGEGHSQWGRVVRVTGPEVYQMDGSGNFINMGWADIPVAWLFKQKPPQTGKTKEVEKELTT